MQDCLFCRIVRGEIPAAKVYEDEHVFAFNGRWGDPLSAARLTRGEAQRVARASIRSHSAWRRAVCL